jgi:ATP-dependent DNA helicase RecQ
MTDLHAALKQHFGFDSFRPGQEAVVRDALAGRDLLAVMPTGGGKSLCFQLPALLQRGAMIVVSPLIALMHDQVRLLADNGIDAAFVNSTLSREDASQRLGAALRGELKLLYVAPERLLMREFLGGFLPRLQQEQGISAFTLDEAHCVSEWGHDFRPEYRQLARLRESFAGVPVMAFTATATPRVRDDIVQQLALRKPAIHVSSFNRPNLYYAVRPKTQKTYEQVLAQARAGGAGIVYCLSRNRVERLAQKLSLDGVAALPYHAGLDGPTRRQHQEKFICDDAQVMVATVAFGMGINKPDVRWVLHYDLPRTLEAYYQEAGRAGRDGDPARCTLFFGAGDIRISQKTHPETGATLDQEQRVARHQLRQVVDYAESDECRRSVQLRYFGEDHSGPCGACDNCTAPQPQEDWTLEARQFLSCIARLAQRGQRFGPQHVIDILRGADSEKILRQGHDRLSTYGIGKVRGLAEWRHLARALGQLGLIDTLGDRYPVLVLNEASRQVLRGERKVAIRAMPPEALSRKLRQRRGAAEVVSPTSSEEALFQRLRALRKRLADAQGVPPYVVFADVALRVMAERRPSTLAAFAEIPGVGGHKLERYGEAFVTDIRAFAGSAATE